MREGKCCLVMHVRSAMYTLLSQLPILSYVSLSLLLSLLFPFKLTVSNFLGYWALFVLAIPLLMIVVFFPYSWVLFVLYLISILDDFPFFPLLSTNHFCLLQALSMFQPYIGGFLPLSFGRWQWVQSHYLLSDKFLSIFGQKPIWPQYHYFSLSLNDKPLLISLVLTL